MDDPENDDSNARIDLPRTRLFLLRIWASGPRLLGHLSLPTGQRIGSFASGEGLVRLLSRETGSNKSSDDRKE